MGLNDSMRNKLQAKVFASGKLASDVTLYTESSAAYDEYGAKINVSETSSSIRAVPYNLFGGRINYQPFGDLEEGESDVIIPYDTVISLKQKITINSVDYEVKDMEDYIVENNKIAIAIRVAKLH